MTTTICGMIIYTVLLTITSIFEVNLIWMYVKNRHSPKISIFPKWAIIPLSLLWITLSICLAASIKVCCEQNVVVEVHMGYISVVDLSDNHKFDINTKSESDYYVNDIVDDAGNIVIFGQALEKAQAQIPEK